MKQIRKDREKLKSIDEDKAHYQILCEMGILDDLEDWDSYKKQDDVIFRQLEEVGDEFYRKYVKLKH